MNNTWLVALVDKLRQNNCFYSCARNGFLRYGRGAISLDVKCPNQYTVEYLLYSAWQCADLEEPRLRAINSTMNTYQPLSQAIVVAISPYGNNFEVTTFLINLN